MKIIKKNHILMSVMGGLFFASTYVLCIMYGAPHIDYFKINKFNCIFILILFKKYAKAKLKMGGLFFPSQIFWIIHPFRSFS